MNFNVLAKMGQSLVMMFWQSCEMKKFAVLLLEKYANSTDNDLDNVAVDIVRNKLLAGCE